MRQDRKIVYLAENQQTGLFKIGKTYEGNIENRLRSLITQSGCDIRLLGFIERDCEADLHERFAARWVIGEWFKLTGEQIDEIRAVEGFRDVLWRLGYVMPPRTVMRALGVGFIPTGERSGFYDLKTNRPKEFVVDFKNGCRFVEDFALTSR